MDNAQAFAKKYLEDLLTFFSLNLEVDATREDHVINLSVPTTDMNGFLIGERGATLRSIQYLVNSALSNASIEPDARVTVDIADYKKQRADRLAEQAREWAQEVLNSGTSMDLNTMNPADRRTVHKAVSEVAGVSTESVGEGRDRHIVIKKD